VMCGLRQSFDHLMYEYFVLSEVVRVVLQIISHILFPFWGLFFIFVLRVFCILEISGRFTLKICSDFCDIYSCRLITGKIL